jgi:hypothetical protein
MTDLDPRNVLLSADGDVRFIDLDDSVFGPAPIAVATFTRRLKGVGAAWAPELYRVYERAWTPPLSIADRWPAFELVSTLVECFLDWERVRRKTARGEVFDVLDSARRRIARRLETAARSSRL